MRSLRGRLIDYVSGYTTKHPQVSGVRQASCFAYGFGGSRFWPGDSKDGIFLLYYACGLILKSSGDFFMLILGTWTGKTWIPWGLLTTAYACVLSMWLDVP